MKRPKGEEILYCDECGRAASELCPDCDNCIDCCLCAQDEFGDDQEDDEDH